MTIYSVFIFFIIILSVWLCFLYKKQRSMLIKLDSIMKSNEKNLINYTVATKLLHGIQSDNEIAKQIERSGFSNIAVYGMGSIGKFLVKKLLEDGIKVLYAIDQDAELIYADVPIYNIQDDLPQVDAVLVTPVYFYEQIQSILEDKLECSIISLYDFLT